jgi:predicted house-cleaning noncanonical NTP pyrophosphatase (MazG superfamily)
VVVSVGREKLVRDLIPDIISREGRTPVVRVALGQELDSLLRAKVVEEAQELLSTGELSEVADIVDVLDALLRVRKKGWRTIDQLSRQKRRLRGGFGKGYVLSLDEHE